MMAGVIDKFNQQINATLAEPRIKARFAGMGATALPRSPADFGKLIFEDTEKWARVVKFSGAKPD
jgi:tripartite-type tricarboxylate transporter receptor subunit TctC